MASPAGPITDISQRLEKRATFVQAVQSITAELVRAEAERLQALLGLLPRVFILLKTRHTSIEAWRVCHACFSLAQKLCDERSGVADTKLQQYVSETRSFLESNDMAVDDQPQAQQGSDLLDMLMAAPRPTEVEPHYDDAGPILPEDTERIQRAQGVSTSSDAPADGDASVSSVAARREEQRMQRARMQAMILEGIQAIYSGMEAMARGTEAVERELDAVLAALQARSMAEHQPPSRPAASKKVVASLPRITLDADKLDKLGRDTTCAVCIETLAEGDVVLEISQCRHIFHEACVSAWLAQNNSCPICRTELPTDNPHYEAAKERRAEQEEEERGAANAIGTLEHMYI